jgi:hypothetical protein
LVLLSCPSFFFFFGAGGALAVIYVIGCGSILDQIVELRQSATKRPLRLSLNLLSAPSENSKVTMSLMTHLQQIAQEPRHNGLGGYCKVKRTLLNKSTRQGIWIFVTVGRMTLFEWK